MRYPKGFNFYLGCSCLQISIYKKYGIEYCDIPKCGSTTWAYFLMYLMGHTFKSNVHGNIFNRYAVRTQSTRIEPEFISFFFIRHPFVRMVSFYQDKLLDERNTEHTPQRFKSLIQNVIKHGPGVNNHVVGYETKCHYCHYNYDVVGKLETDSESD